MLKKNELNILNLKAGDKIIIQTSIKYDEYGRRVTNEVKATVVELYNRFFRAKICGKSGEYCKCVNYISNKDVKKHGVLRYKIKSIL